MGRSGAGWRGLLLLTAVALAARALALGDPVVHPDEQFYLTVARRWLAGAIPYVGTWDRKPVGLFLLYLPAAALADPWAATLAYQLGALAAAVAAAWLVAALARAAGWRRGAVPAAVLYLLWLDLAAGQGGQAPVFYNPLMAAAALLIVQPPARWGARRAGVAAMGLVGLALQIKTSVVFEGAWFGAWLVWRDAARRPAARLAYAAALAGAAALPTLVAAGAYAAIGAGQAWWFATVISILRRQAAPWPEQLGNLATCVALLAMPVGLAVAGWRRAPATDARRFLWGWLACALAGLAVFGTWFDHYTLPVLVPTLAAGAAVLGRGAARWALVAAAALAGQASLVAMRARQGTPAEFAALAAAVGTGPGCLYVYAGPSMLYPFTGRCAASRFVFASHLTRAREAAAIGVAPAAELTRLLATRPAVVVMGRPFRGEAPAIRALALRRLAAEGYAPTGSWPLGRDRLTLYRRR